MNDPSEAPASFNRKKAAILQQLAVPTSEYSDLSPKGSVDEAIRALIDEINTSEGLVTTSSCAGRVSVFLEGVRRHAGRPGLGQNDEVSNGQLAGPGGKGGGGRWLFVSHDPVKIPKESGDDSYLRNLFNLPPKSTSDFRASENTRYVHVKFEPMILHILTSSLKEAQKVLTAALQAGFRESGALNIEGTGPLSSTPMVAVRSTGLMFDSVIGFTRNVNGLEEIQVSVGDDHLQMLTEIANERFQVNQERIQRFQSLLFSQREFKSAKQKHQTASGGEWEDSESRRARKRAEGQKKREELQSQKSSVATGDDNDDSLDFMGSILG